MNTLYLKLIGAFVVVGLVIALGMSLKANGRKDAEVRQVNAQLVLAQTAIRERDDRIASFANTAAGQAEAQVVQCAQQGGEGYARGLAVGRAICAAR